MNMNLLYFHIHTCTHIGDNIVYIFILNLIVKYIITNKLQ